MAKILIVEDHALFRLGIKTALSHSKAQHEIVAEAATGEEAFKLLKTHTPDIILLDIILPDMHGDAIAARVKEEYPAIHILVLSSETDENMILKLVDIGVDGFISKDDTQSNLPDAIGCILDGDQYFGSRVSRILNSLIYDQKKHGKNYHPEFSPRELEIIDLCCEGLATKNISAKMGVSPRTVEAHKANIFQKLGINNVVELARYAFKHGLVDL